MVTTSEVIVGTKQLEQKLKEIENSLEQLQQEKIDLPRFDMVYLEQQLDKIEDASGKLQQEKVEVLNNLSSNYMVLGRYADAEKHFKMLLELKPYTGKNPADDPVGFWAQESIELCVQLREMIQNDSYRH